ncbi:MAG: hypothetical protein MK297_09290 [Planctomycetes bacterium]|nr:hypothetical protein [Planctomycetota bacterium]
MRKTGFITLILGLFLIAGVAIADVVVLKDGRRIEGVVLVENDSVVKIQTGLGLLEFKRSEVESIERKKTRREQFNERFEAAKTGDEFHELGLWAESKRMRSQAKKAMNRAIEVEPDHVKARAWLGFVRYKGEWMTPEEREARMVADEDAEMRARGLVKYEERWVTPEEKEKLEAGLVLHEGRWIPFADAQRARGFELFEESWIPRAEAVARDEVQRAAAIAEVDFNTHVCGQAVLAGNVDDLTLQAVGAGLEEGRKWFDSVFKTPEGLELFNGHMPELYLFGQDHAPYLATLEHFSTRSDTLPPGWAKAVKNTHGFLWWDPWPVSSARRWNRGDTDLNGHCYHHWGHMLLNSMQYDGRLLPPWYDEGFAAVIENRLHGLNAVFCRAKASTPGGTVARGTTWSFDPKLLRTGRWREILGKALDDNAVRDFDRLARKEFHDLDLVDTVVAMGIIEWVVAKGDITEFHKVIRETAPEVPKRVIETVSERKEVYDKAFRAATKLDMRAADKAWRDWFKKSGRKGPGAEDEGGRVG